MSAASAVLSIAEILEQIISELPPFDIIRCQRVNSTLKKLITSSPLLQYKAWLRNDYPDSAHHVRAEDLMPKFCPCSIKKGVEYGNQRFLYNISKHLHPIVVARIMQHPPDDARYQFEPIAGGLNAGMDTDGFGGYLHFRPILIRDPRHWYEKNKSTEHIWGQISLYRPDARKITWQTGNSGGAGIHFTREAVRIGHPHSRSHDCIVKKAEQPLILTLGDLMNGLDSAWKNWIESEEDEHYFSHDGAGCDLDQGIPGKGCLESAKMEENPTFETMMTMEEHIEQAIQATC
jgi:hypothetical protein